MERLTLFKRQTARWLSSHSTHVLLCRASVLEGFACYLIPRMGGLFNNNKVIPASQHPYMQVSSRRPLFLDRTTLSPF